MGVKNTFFSCLLILTACGRGSGPRISDYEKAISIIATGPISEASKGGIDADLYACGKQFPTGYKIRSISRVGKSDLMVFYSETHFKDTQFKCAWHVEHAYGNVLGVKFGIEMNGLNEKTEFSAINRFKVDLTNGAWE